MSPRPTLMGDRKAPTIGYELNSFDDDHHTITREEYHRRDKVSERTPGRAVARDKRHTRGR